MHKLRLKSSWFRLLNHASFCSILLLSFSAESIAAFSEKEYFDALKIAQKKVERTKPTGFSANALSSAILEKTLGRSYRVGETWTVAAFHEDPPIARPFARPEKNTGINGRAGIFNYEVKETSPEVKIEVRQVRAFGLEAVDPRVETLTLHMNEATVQTHKIYTSRAGRSLSVSPEGIHSNISLLELFPLDVPEIVTAAEQGPRAIPSLPAALESIRSRAGAPFDENNSIWFEQDDFFGRPIQILWQKGQPWPHYLKTPGGVAILLGKVES